MQLQTLNAAAKIIREASQGSTKLSDSRNYQRPHVPPVYLEDIEQNQTYLPNVSAYMNLPMQQYIHRDVPSSSLGLTK